MGHKKHKLEYEPVIEDTDDVPIEFANLDRKLNRKQRNFIWLAVNNPRLSLVECASKAGYKDPRQRAYALFKNPEVRKEYNFLQNELKKKYELNYDRAVQYQGSNSRCTRKDTKLTDCKVSEQAVQEELAILDLSKHVQDIALCAGSDSYNYL